MEPHLEHIQKEVERKLERPLSAKEMFYLALSQVCAPESQQSLPEADETEGA